LQLACFHQDWPLAWQALQEASRVIKALAGAPYLVDYCVYGFQAAAHVAGHGGPDAGTARRLVRRFHRQMRGWARHCPENFQHHAWLMDAERARLAGRDDLAPTLYEQAIQAARRAGFVRDEARANELAAAHYQARGLERVASAYMRDARDGYVRWGAKAKVRALDMAMQAPPGAASDRPEPGLLDLGQVPQLVESGRLDLATVWKATQAISGEPTLERLLAQLLTLVKESAGAQRGVLVLDAGTEGQPRYMVQAEIDEDDQTRLLAAEPLEAHEGAPVSLLRFVLRSRTSVVLNRASEEGDYTRDPYIERHQPASALALPIVHQGQLLGALYLENRLLGDVFTPERLSVLKILAGQAAVSLGNMRAAERAAYLEVERTVKDGYARQLEARVAERTAELSEAYQKLMELDRLKTDFLSVVSHELRTPLTTIQGYAEFLEEGLGGRITDEQQEFVKQIQAGTVQLRRLVDDLLDFARVESGSFKLVCTRVDLGKVLTETLDSLQPSLK
ncbi:MAG: histidine kinase dimerization/phospho-acceptor domain-containing protein, partial [Candidatus Sericytochromatia bacterium]